MNYIDNNNEISCNSLGHLLCKRRKEEMKPRFAGYAKKKLITKCENNLSHLQSRNASRVGKKGGGRDRSSSQDSEDFFTGESDEEFVSISSNSDKAPRVSWTCEFCTYVNNPGVKVGREERDRRKAGRVKEGKREGGKTERR